MNFILLTKLHNAQSFRLHLCRNFFHYISPRSCRDFHKSRLLKFIRQNAATADLTSEASSTSFQVFKKKLFPKLSKTTSNRNKLCEENHPWKTNFPRKSLRVEITLHLGYNLHCSAWSLSLHLNFDTDKRHLGTPNVKFYLSFSKGSFHCYIVVHILNG